MSRTYVGIIHEDRDYLFLYDKGKRSCATISLSALIQDRLSIKNDLRETISYHDIVPAEFLFNEQKEI